MWRTRSVHKRGETEYLDAALERLARDARLRERADAAIRAAARQEPLFEEALRTPQSPPFHCEGPFLEDHLRAMLVALYGLAEEKFHLIDVEEFRRLTGYEGEIDEMEEMAKENLALMEAFVLCHDAGKWAALSFTSEEGSEGRRLGFQMRRESDWHEIGVPERAKFRAKYLELYDAFAAERAEEPSRAVQAAFFSAYGIRAHYPGHERLVHASVYHGLMHRFAAARRLTDRDTNLLEDLIANHIDAGLAFAETAEPGKADRFVKIAADREYDADDFLDLLQACLFLDMACGSARRSDHGPWHDPSSVINFLRAEHDYAPWKRAEKEAVREEEKKRARNRAFRAVGLDGVALMELLRMEPGPAFGEMMRRIQAAVVGEGPMPKLPKGVAEEVGTRAEKFYEATFEKGGSDE
jgi:hypothetical protein